MSNTRAEVCLKNDTPVRLDIVIPPLPKRIEGRYLGLVFGVLVGVLGSHLLHPQSLPGHTRPTFDDWIQRAGEDASVLALLLVCTAITSVAGFLTGYLIDLYNNRGINRLNQELKELEGRFHRLQRQSPQPVSELNAVLDHIVIVDHEYRKVSGWSPPQVHRTVLFWALLLPITLLLVRLTTWLISEGIQSGVMPSLPQLRVALPSLFLTPWHVAWAAAGGLLGWANFELAKCKDQLKNRHLSMAAAITHLSLFLFGQTCVVLSAFLACATIGISLGRPFTWAILGGALAAVGALLARKKGLV